MTIIANEVPHVTVQWDESARGLTSQQVTERLLAADPPIHVQRPGKGQLLISVWMMRGDEHKIVGRRLREILGRQQDGACLGFRQSPGGSLSERDCVKNESPAASKRAKPLRSSPSTRFPRVHHCSSVGSFWRRRVPTPVHLRECLTYANRNNYQRASGVARWEVWKGSARTRERAIFDLHPTLPRRRTQSPLSTTPSRILCKRICLTDWLLGYTGA